MYGHVFVPYPFYGHTNHSQSLNPPYIRVLLSAVIHHQGPPYDLDLAHCHPEPLKRPRNDSQSGTNSPAAFHEPEPLTSVASFPLGTEGRCVGQQRFITPQRLGREMVSGYWLRGNGFRWRMYLLTMILVHATGMTATKRVLYAY